MTGSGGGVGSDRFNFFLRRGIVNLLFFLSVGYFVLPGGRDERLLYLPKRFIEVRDKESGGAMALHISCKICATVRQGRENEKISHMIEAD